MKNALKTGLKAAWGGVIATTMIATPAADMALAQEAANTNDAQVTLASTGRVRILQDADLPADMWVRDNPTGIAVSVRLGRGTEVPPATIENVLRQDFANNRFSNVEFFFEQGGEGNSTVAFHRLNYVHGPYRLSQSRGEVAQVTGQHRFEMANNLN